jgi:hypothetical protein
MGACERAGGANISRSGTARHDVSAHVTQAVRPRAGHPSAARQKSRRGSRLRTDLNRQGARTPRIEDFLSCPLASLAPSRFDPRQDFWRAALVPPVRRSIRVPPERERRRLRLRGILAGLPSFASASRYRARNRLKTRENEPQRHRGHRVFLFSLCSLCLCGSNLLSFAVFQPVRRSRLAQRTSSRFDRWSVRGSDGLSRIR